MPKRESRTARRRRENAERAALAALPDREAEQDRYFRDLRLQMRTTPRRLTRLSPGLLRFAVGKFLCWVDAFALSRVSRHCKDSCRPFEEDFYALIRSATDLKEENVREAIAKGLCFSGSLIHQALYGVRYTPYNRYNHSAYDDEEERKEEKKVSRYLQTDIDGYYVAKGYSADRIGFTGEDKYSTTLVPDDDPDSVTLSHISNHSPQAADTLHWEDESYNEYLPLYCHKYHVFPPGVVPKLKEQKKEKKRSERDGFGALGDGEEEEEEDRGFTYTEPLWKQQETLTAKYKSNTSVDLIGIKHQHSVQDFMTQFVDMSHCMIYYGLGPEEKKKNPGKRYYDYNQCRYRYEDEDEEKPDLPEEKKPELKPKLHWRNMDHLWERKFQMRWELDRYVKHRARDGYFGSYSRRMWEVDAHVIDQLANRLMTRCSKYEYRGFTCINPKEGIDAYNYGKNERKRLAPKPASPPPPPRRKLPSRKMSMSDDDDDNRYDGYESY